jgi:hypothetical protein
MFESEHMFCLWIQRFPPCVASAQLAWAAAWRSGWPWQKRHGGGCESLLQGGGLDSDLICYRSTWLFWDCILNSTFVRLFVFVRARRRENVVKVSFCDMTNTKKHSQNTQQGFILHCNKTTFFPTSVNSALKIKPLT